jgi:tyrosine-protein kinase Etk/Wzc
VDAAVVRFVFVARNPELARDAVGALADHAIERSRAQGERHAAATMTVLREELEKVAEDLADKSDQLAALAARRRTPVQSVDEQLEAARAEHLADLNALRALEGEVARAEARYTAKHPTLLQLREELARQRALVSAPPRSAALQSASLESDLEHRALLREYETSLKSYESLLARQIDATLASRLGRGGDVPEIRVLREPTLPLRPQASLPFPALGALLGLGLAGLAALWPTLVRPSFSRVATLEAASGLPVVAALPELTGLAHGTRGLVAPESLAGEQFRRVLPYLARAGATPVVLVTAAARGVGASWCTANLGAAVAASGQRRALLIDANLRDPSLHAWASVPPGPGLVECVRGDLSLSTALMPTRTPNLYLLRAGGGGAGDGLATLDDERLGKLLEQARRDFDAVFVDAPPRGVVVDTELLERVATQLLVVVRAEHTPQTSVQRALRGVELPTGLVLNRMDVRAHRAHFGGDLAGLGYGDERRR